MEKSISRWSWYRFAVFAVFLVGAACTGVQSQDEPPGAAVTRGERSATTIERDHIYYTTVTERGQVVFRMEVRAEADARLFRFRLYDTDVTEPIADELRVPGAGEVVGLGELSSFALGAYHTKWTQRREDLGLAVAQDSPGCDAVWASCGSQGSCCDKHDRCIEEANDTSQSRAQRRLRKAGHNCTADVIACSAAAVVGIGAGPSECCSIAAPGSPTCLPAGTFVQSCGWNNCCNGAVDFATETFCSSPYNAGHCISGPNPEPSNICQTFDAEWSTWGNHGAPNYWSNAVCRDGVCSPGEFASWVDSYDGNCMTDCGFRAPCDWYDCQGTCNGGVWNDACGVCGGDGSSCAPACSWYDCQGTCNGNVWNDACGVCGGDGSSCAPACDWYDCQGTCNGGVGTDVCGVCGGDGTSCAP